MTLTQTDLAGLRELEQAATAGPLAIKYDNDSPVWREWYDILDSTGDKIGEMSKVEDADCATALRNAAPQLLTDLEEARALLAAFVQGSHGSCDEGYCGFCGTYGNSQHNPDCPYEKARAHLAAAGVEVG